ncbi:MAG: RibD family protein [Verrucomicrobiales bacterium]
MRISLNLALSADGKITTSPPHPARFTSTEDLDQLLRLRTRADALLVGHGTLKSDRMTLTVPEEQRENRPPPLRCVASRSGHFDPAHPLFRTPGGPIHLLATAPETPLSPKNFPTATLHQRSLTEFLNHLEKEIGIRQLHCEGGGQLIASLLRLRPVHELHLTLATHSLFGGREAPTLTGPLGDFLPASARYELLDHQAHETGELFLHYRLRPA